VPILSGYFFDLGGCYKVIPVVLRRTAGPSGSEIVFPGGDLSSDAEMIMTEAVSIDASSAVRRGDCVPLWSRVLELNPKAVVLQIEAASHVEPWLKVIEVWRSRIDAATVQPAVLVQLTTGDVASFGPELMVRALDSGVDDLVIAKQDSPELMLRLVQAVRFRAMTQHLQATNRQLAHLSCTDDLTGLLNMRSFKPQLASANQHCRDGRYAMAVVMMDIDFFKQVNDRNNHMVGSDVLRAVGHLLREWNSGDVAQSFSRAARYGGDEFVFCFSAESVGDAFDAVNALRELIAGQTFLTHGRVVRVTASFGISWSPARLHIDSGRMLEGADAMLYRSKAGGRNCVSAIDLGNPVDFNHVGRTNLIDWNAGRDDDRVSRVDQSEIFKKVG